VTSQFEDLDASYVVLVNDEGHRRDMRPKSLIEAMGE
jgi:uncharacterized protein YbdZ (MbtH family)